MEKEIHRKISLQSRSVRDLIYEGLKEAIINGEYEAGYHLRERKLANEFNVSTTPIKEAFRLLENEGLVVTQARKGTFVSDSVMRSVQEISRVRAALEGVAARFAALKRTEEELKQLEAIIVQMSKFTKEKNTQQLSESNRLFHQLIRQFARNGFIYKQVEAVHSYDQFIRNKALSDIVEHERAYEEHYEIFKMIEAQDINRAEDLMRNHIIRSADFALH
ncbi:GntR family transcriptional regulator [Oceanobacillus bengalensis]|uniref:GntR family transcriptional regulator n=1 Tax=Oceanobacillus bengalensis TaxID=1435466 RepID=A0A494YTV2_9BACI|nr:GntR family transcriptional regulator [Oceanobacillus bengalensis]RKQ13554.1 GntR family transcriptional regulator [Oceanobacillus bengalensis]